MSACLIWVFYVWPVAVRKSGCRYLWHMRHHKLHKEKEDATEFVPPSVGRPAQRGQTRRWGDNFTLSVKQGISSNWRLWLAIRRVFRKRWRGGEPRLQLHAATHATKADFWCDPIFFLAGILPFVPEQCSVLFFRLTEMHFAHCTLMDFETSEK